MFDIINQHCKNHNVALKTVEEKQGRLTIKTRDAKFPGILRWVNFHQEFCGNIGNFREYSETLGIFK